jgi:hypothetical protein
LALIGGCGSDPPGQRIISLTGADSGRGVVAEVGDRIEVTLQTIGPGQYGDPILSSAAVTFLGEEPAGPPNPGGPRQLYRFEAAASGQCAITIPHTDGFPGGPATPAFAITVTVQ